jgi:flagellar basal body-associated protein FliL
MNYLRTKKQNSKFREELNWIPIYVFIVAVLAAMLLVTI